MTKHTIELKEIGNMSRRELKQAIVDCFEHAQEDAEAEDRLAVLLEAQFYTRELESRRDSWTSIRDFILEIIVIVLIGGELWLGVHQGRAQAKASELEQGVLTNLQTSSAATATILQSLQLTTEQMNSAIQDEANLNYRVSVDVTFDTGAKRVNVTNKGRSDLWLWGSRTGNEKTEFAKMPRSISSGGFYYIVADAFYDELSKNSKESPVTIPFELFLRSANGKDYVVSSQFTGVWQKDSFVIHAQTLSIAQRDWSHRH